MGPHSVTEGSYSSLPHPILEVSVIQYDVRAVPLHGQTDSGMGSTEYLVAAFGRRGREVELFCGWWVAVRRVPRRVPN